MVFVIQYFSPKPLTIIRLRIRLRLRLRHNMHTNLWSHLGVRSEVKGPEGVRRPVSSLGE